MAEKNEDPQSETIAPYEVGSKESLISNKGNGVILNVSDLERKPLCRICYSGSSKEKLIRPCKCKGKIDLRQSWLKFHKYVRC